MPRSAQLGLPPRLWREYREEVLHQWGIAAQYRLREVKTRLTKGILHLALYSPNGLATAPVGFAIYKDEPHAGRRVELIHLGPGYRTGPHLNAFIQQLERRKGPRILSIHGLFTGIPDRIVDRDLTRLGFLRVERVKLCLDPQLARRVAPPSRLISIRPVRRSDRGALMRLFQRAFHHEIDELFGFTMDRAENARKFIEFVLHSSRDGQFVHSASFVIEGRGSGALRGAVLVRRSPRIVYVADLMVDPKFQKQGIGTTLMGASIETLRRSGLRRLELMVTLQNSTRAAQFYGRLGFRPLSRNIQIPMLWVRTSSLTRMGVRFEEGHPFSPSGSTRIPA